MKLFVATHLSKNPFVFVKHACTRLTNSNASVEILFLPFFKVDCTNKYALRRCGKVHNKLHNEYLTISMWELCHSTIIERTSKRWSVWRNKLISKSICLYYLFIIKYFAIEIEIIHFRKKKHFLLWSIEIFR